MISKNNLYSSYFKLHVRWLLSFTRIIDWRQLIGTHSFAAYLQLELFRVYIVYQ
ncbi:LysE family transporter [Yersinia enterocolitica]|nr:LysE family transporter [Yersinia enterocolitica]